MTPTPAENPRYQPFHIWIAGTAAAPVAAVDGAPGGSVPQTPLDLTELAPVRNLLTQVRAGARDPGTVAALGRGLFAILFPPPLRDLYQRSLGRLAPGARLRLLLRCDVPDLAALPWEWLCDPQAPVPAGAFLALDPTISLARYLPQPARPAPAPRSSPLRVLGVFSGPRDQPRLNLARDLRLMAGALAALPAGAITFDVLAATDTVQAAGLGVAPLGPPTPAALTAALAAGYDVLHYSGHGAYLDTEGGILALLDSAGNTVHFDSDSLAVAAQGTRLRLAVLSACETAAAAGGPAAPAPAPDTSGRAIIADTGQPAAPEVSLLPVAPALVAAGLGAVVAMQFRIPDDSAITFGQTFYREVARNSSIDACVGEARKAIRIEELNIRADWGIPVLFLQDVGDGYLWQTAGAPATPAAQPPAGTGAPRTTISTGPISSGGGPVAVGGNVIDQRRQGGIEFFGPTSVTGPVIGGDVTNLTLGDIVGGDKTQVGNVSGSGIAIGRGAQAGIPAAGPPAAGPPTADRVAGLRPAFGALVAAIDDDTLLDRARELRAELLAPQPSWPRLAALRATLAAGPGLADAVAAFFADPGVRPIVNEAKLRAVENP